MTGNQQKSGDKRKIDVEVAVSGRSVLKELKDSLTRLPAKKEILLQISGAGIARSLKIIQSALSAVGKVANGGDDAPEKARSEQALREARHLKGGALSDGEIASIRRLADLTRMLEERGNGSPRGRSAGFSERPPVRGGFSGAERFSDGGRPDGEVRRQTEFLEKIYNILDRLEQ